MIDEVPRWTPTQKLERERERQHEIRMAELHRAQPTADRIGVACDEDGRFSWNVGVVRGDGETLVEALERMTAVATRCLETFPHTPHVVASVAANAKGDWQLDAKGDTALVIDRAKGLREQFPLSRSQNFGRDYLPNEKGK